ncbi:glycosyltransferase [Dysgonomonas sp. HDW5A]|nr:glycosyltransferase [Dysgonomonas sp. HDW5A]
MGNNRLSIIIPLYNVEDYIERCILSIVRQSIDTDKYELIVVNDGSTDRSESIVRKLQSNYPFIKLIKKENGGLSSARNKGLDIASGDYIFFVDADDWVSPDSLSQLLDIINTNPDDIILFKVAEVYPDGKTKSIHFHLPKSNQMLPVDDYICNYTILSAAWQGLFKRSLFTDHNIRMPEGYLAEDDDLVVKLYSVAETIYYLPIEGYNYYQRPQSISNNSDTHHNEKLIKDRISIFRELVIYVQRFTGKRKMGLERKLNFLALDIIRLLIRKSQTRPTIDAILRQLSDLGYFPLSRKAYSVKYTILRTLLNKPSRIRFFTSLKKSEKFF